MPDSIVLTTQTRATPLRSPEERTLVDIVDIVGEDSFPASDPPSSWTWEVGTS